ncbi:hypothetical protein LIER_02197 [Lithospermum erythrorhizon]|uniref:Uncharacterized protein n=1 Tax=Lithospermum erythrorhizon TaxID=34254 RepID=A0AAV3NPX9_LITER
MDHTSSNKRKIFRPHEANKLAKRKRNETFSHKTNSISKNDEDQLMLDGGSSFKAAVTVDNIRRLMAVDEASKEVITPPPCGGERVKKYWAELGARRVFIPERWNQEGLLMDWIDYSSFDSLLAPKGIDSARKALIAQAQATKISSTREKLSQPKRSTNSYS